MDLPPPVSPVSQIIIKDYDSKISEDIIIFNYGFYDVDVPENIIKAARETDCRYLTKSSRLSYAIYKGKKQVYHCLINNKNKFIFDNGKSFHFATPYERIRYYRIFRKYFYF